MQTHALLQQVDTEPKETAAGASYPHADGQTNISVQGWDATPRFQQ